MNQRILFADDNAMILKSLRRALCSKYDLDFAYNANEEIAKARQAVSSGQNYSAIVTDNDMGDGINNSGLYAIKEIRKFDSKTPIYICTSNPDDRIKQNALELGATGILSKPINIGEFHGLMARIRETK